MSELFIKEIEIKNYKLFKDFKAQGFGRVNLISGKNNVGKSAFMEACYLVSQNYSLALEEIIFSRYQLNILEDLLKSAGVEFVNNFIKEKINDLGSIEINNKKILYDNSNKKRINNINLITPIGISNYRFNKFYSVVIEKSLEDKVDSYINNFEKTIDRFRIIENQPKCRKKSDKNFIDLNEYGDGLSKYISYLLSLINSENGILFIDEIENGIHYTNFDKLWEIILTISKEQNVQVFATTHSIECIQSYARVAKKLLEDKKIDKEDIAFIEMGINKYNKPRAIVMDSERFFRELEIGNEVRGW